MLLRMLNRAEEAIIALLLVTMTLLVFIEVVMRFGFGGGFLWAQELTLHLSAWFVLFGVSYGLKVGAHIGVDAFIKLLPENGQRFLSSIAVLLSLAYCGLFLYGSWIYRETKRARRRNERKRRVGPRPRSHRLRGPGPRPGDSRLLRPDRSRAHPRRHSWQARNAQRPGEPR